MMPRNARAKPKLTDAQRHERFVETAHAVEASEDPKDFEKAFKKVTAPVKPTSPSRP
ncbi:MAG: hypothetical protein JWP28_3737 [Phenylobacterium sp.]|jgi:hypothetical protein|nr:hypothetical protein [Phenylobacterium sp.]